MEQYLALVDRILTSGAMKENRTGVPALTLPGAIFEHDLSTGFPELTTKQMAWKTQKVELEGFIKGKTDKRWYQDNGCHIWDDWCNPKKVPYGHDEDTKRKMLEERDLGPIYGFQWRHFGARYKDPFHDYTGEGVDQLQNLLNSLKFKPNDRRMIVNSWNPMDLEMMALPPCHVLFKASVEKDVLNLSWYQRSVDTMVGLPFNIAQYALMLHLLAKEANLKEGKLTGHLDEVHVYQPHIENAKEQSKRKPFNLPRIDTPHFASVLDWNNKQTNLMNYEHHPRMEYVIVV